ncbi:MAG: hypothetical protein OFPI_14750 [Osedax symbiont Rs2]|nr:MAG: hypothetical protein OFPI_14750 [Osedax symbiont Rs2]
MKDLAHGLCNIEFKDSILTLEVTGPFNEQHVQNLQCQLQKALLNVDSPWGQLTLLHQDCIFTPQAEQEMYHTVKLRKQRGICAIAVVFVNKVRTMIIERQLTRIYQQFDIDHAYFIDADTAAVWIKEQLAMQQAN